MRGAAARHGEARSAFLDRLQPQQQPPQPRSSRSRRRGSSPCRGRSRRRLERRPRAGGERRRAAQSHPAGVRRRGREGGEAAAGVRATVRDAAQPKEALALDVLKALGLRPAGRLFARWRVTFEGEQGRDDGGILVATYAKVHRHLYGCTATRHLFEVDPDAERGIADSETCVLPLADASGPPPRRASAQPPDAAASPPPAAGSSGAGSSGAGAARKRQRWTPDVGGGGAVAVRPAAHKVLLDGDWHSVDDRLPDFVLEYLVTDNTRR